jgi:hypothetical protein
MSESDPPTPWRIAGGPRPLLQDLVDGAASLFTLERHDQERSVVVIVSRQALTHEQPEALPVMTREAIATDRRSEAARVAQLDDPTSCVVLGRDGYLPPPPGLMCQLDS